MPASSASDRLDDGALREAPESLNLRQRALVSLPRFKTSEEKNAREPINDWARRTFMKPEDPAAAKTNNAAEPQSVDELQDLVKRANDKERAIGLVAAPLGAAIGWMIIHALVFNDPQYLANRQLNPHYVNQSIYGELFLVLLGLSVLVLVMSLLRKRLYLGMALALYGLAVFNLHYWGFGVPFVMAGAWYLVRAYRLNRDLREATGGTTRFEAAKNARGNRSSYASGPGRNKRYTPPASRARRA
jgi:hypothetical protein